jgi:plastocyanin
MKKRSLFVLAGFSLLIIVSACAHLQAPISAEEGRNVVEMTVSDFKFEPNNITARPGATITFRIHNVSGTTHNFTLKDPDGSMMQNVDIPPKGSVDVKATFSKAGTYTFHCNKTGHSELGMKGQVVATGP